MLQFSPPPLVAQWGLKDGERGLACLTDRKTTRYGSRWKGGKEIVGVKAPWKIKLQTDWYVSWRCSCSSRSFRYSWCFCIARCGRSGVRGILVRGELWKISGKVSEESQWSFCRNFACVLTMKIVAERMGERFEWTLNVYGILQLIRLTFTTLNVYGIQTFNWFA